MNSFILTLLMLFNTVTYTSLGTEPTESKDNSSTSEVKADEAAIPNIDYPGCYWERDSTPYHIICIQCKSNCYDGAPPKCLNCVTNCPNCVSIEEVSDDYYRFTVRNPENQVIDIRYGSSYEVNEILVDDYPAFEVIIHP